MCENIFEYLYMFHVKHIKKGIFHCYILINNEICLYFILFNVIHYLSNNNYLIVIIPFFIANTAACVLSDT